MSNPKISVGMPVFNGELFIEEAILSILNQTDPEFEFIISDNASTDKTAQICLDYSAQDKRIIYICNKENIGAAKNYARTFEQSTGKYFRWFNADDISATTLHERCVKVLDANQDVVLCYGQTDYIDNRGNLLTHYDDRLNLQENNACQRFVNFFNTVRDTNIIYGLMRRDTVAKTMLMGNAKFSGGDINFMAEMTLYGKFFEIPEKLFYRRLHENASSWDISNKITQQKFWKGQASAFVLPSWRKNFAYLKAIENSPITILEKFKLKKFILHHMIWKRKTLLEEVYQEILRLFRK